MTNPSDQIVKIYNSNGKIPETSASVGRLIEEVTELGLASGLSSNEIMGHVMDAIYNEASKVSKYPSQNTTPYNEEAVREELADVTLWLGVLTGSAYGGSFRTRVIAEEAERKADRLARYYANGNLEFTTSGTFYRKVK